MRDGLAHVIFDRRDRDAELAVNLVVRHPSQTMHDENAAGLSGQASKRSLDREFQIIGFKCFRLPGCIGSVMRLDQRKRLDPATVAPCVIDQSVLGHSA